MFYFATAVIWAIFLLLSTVHIVAAYNQSVTLAQGLRRCLTTLDPRWWPPAPPQDSEPGPPRPGRHAEHASLRLAARRGRGRVPVPPEGHAHAGPWGQRRCARTSWLGSRSRAGSRRSWPGRRDASSRREAAWGAACRRALTQGSSALTEPLGPRRCPPVGAARPPSPVARRAAVPSARAHAPRGPARPGNHCPRRRADWPPPPVKRKPVRVC
jgi:hypothetical protein